MTQGVLQRIDASGKAVRGSLVFNKNGRVPFRCAGIENGETLIAPGNYLLKWTLSPRFSKKAGKDVWTPEITGVANRSGLRIHVSNYASELKGCFAPGWDFSDINGDGTIDISRSRPAYDALVDFLLTEGIQSTPIPFAIRNAAPLKFGKVK